MARLASGVAISMKVKYYLLVIGVSCLYRKFDSVPETCPHVKEKKFPPTDCEKALVVAISL